MDFLPPSLTEPCQIYQAWDKVGEEQGASGCRRNVLIINLLSDRHHRWWWDKEESHSKHQAIQKKPRRRVVGLGKPVWWVTVCQAPTFPLLIFLTFYCETFNTDVSRFVNSLLSLMHHDPPIFPCLYPSFNPFLALVTSKWTMDLSILPGKYFSMTLVK